MKNYFCINAFIFFLGLVVSNAETSGLRRALRPQECYTSKDELKRDVNRYLKDPDFREEKGGKLPHCPMQLADRRFLIYKR